MAGVPSERVVDSANDQAKIDAKRKFGEGSKSFGEREVRQEVRPTSSLQPTRKVTHDQMAYHECFKQ